MKKILLLIGILIPSFLLAQTSIYDIQFTEDAGSDGWSYPSAYNGQIVTTGGIVTANNYSGGRYFIECSNGGAWNGLFVYDNYYSPNIGDSILITGTIVEYQGYTELKDITSYSVKSTGNDLPPAIVVPSNEIGWEQYEGLLVQVNNGSVKEIFGISGGFSVNDGSGVGEVSTGIYSLTNDGFPLVQNYLFSKIVGVVGINSWDRKLHPRSIDDVVSASDKFILSTEDKIVLTTGKFTYPVSLSLLNQANTISSYSLKLHYDNTTFEYNGFSKTGTLSESGTIVDASVSTAGNIELNFTGNVSCDDVEILINLEFTPISQGDAAIQFNAPTINGNSVEYFSLGKLEYSDGSCDIEKADTLTIVQRPLLSIPSIVTPGQEMDIECFAPLSTTDWNVELFYNNITVPLSIKQSTYSSELKKWTLTVSIPDVDLYELYDMRVTASEGLSDEVANVVKIIDRFKTDYYFIQITDLHLPGHTFYGDSGYETDHTELDDLQEVINDINLLNPEFVLLTGDLINEGELEDFECLRHHSLAYDMLKEFEVPVYVVPGNHDLGGWDATPPPSGTARKEWWKFFGWRQQSIPPTNDEYISNDYSFDYGNTHFVGLDAYEIYGDYDDYMIDIYGSTSFTAEQMTWLNADLAAAGDKTKVLFYHCDYKDQINLSNLGADMALWGHIHRDEGDINSYPYNLSTDNVCDENRAFRVIYVNGNTLQPTNSVRTHANGDMLTLSYNNNNDGTNNSITATINNKYNLPFNNALVKFVMPESEFGYSITNGTLLQTTVNGSNVICYVSVSLAKTNSVSVTIEKNISDITDVGNVSEDLGFNRYPNPFTNEIVFEYTLKMEGKVFIAIYNLAGQLIKVLTDKNQIAGNYTLQWDASNSTNNKLEAGTYLYKYMVNGLQRASGQIIYLK